MAMIDAAMMGSGDGARTAYAPFGEALVAVARHSAQVVALSADLAKYTDLAPFIEAFPERFFQMGMAEQNMMGVAGGLARAGLQPFVTTYGVFATRRAYDQVAMAIALGRADVKIVAFLPGLTTPGGPTHQAIEDLALMRALPNMVVIDPADAVELAAATRAVSEQRGPVYMRGLRGAVPVLFGPGYRFAIGKAQLLRTGADCALVSSGIMTARALEAADILQRRSISSAVLHVGTLKPLDKETLMGVARACRVLVTVENHSVVGGLGSAVAEALAEAGWPGRLLRLGIQDVFPQAGSLDYLLARHGLTAPAIADAVQRQLAAG